MDKSDQKKLIFAVVILILAGVAIAWGMGMFSGGGTTDLNDLEVQEEQPGRPTGGRMVAPGG